MKTARTFPRIASWLIAAAASFGLGIWIFAPVVVRRTHTFLTNWDAAVQSYAWDTAVYAATRNFTVKLWDFTTASGESFIGEMQTAPLYPVNWLFAWFGNPADPDLLEWKIVFHFSLASLFCYAWLRHNRLDRLPAACGGMIFAYVGSICLRAPEQPNIFESLVYLPLVLLFAQRAFESERPFLRNRWIPMAGAAVGVMILAGHMQPAVHAGIATLWLACYVAGPRPSRLFRGLLTLAGIALCAGLLAAPQLAATIEYMDRAYRWIGLSNPTRPPHVIPYSVYGFAYVLHWRDFGSLIHAAYAPQDATTLYFTPVGLALAGIALITRRRLVGFALPLALGAILIALGDATIVGRLSYHIGLLRDIREPIRVLCLYQLAAAALAALGLQWIFRYPRAPRWAGWTAGAVVLALLLSEIVPSARMRILPRSVGNQYPGRYYASSESSNFVLQTRLLEDGGPTRYMTFPNELLPPNLGNVTGALSTRSHRATMPIVYFDYLSRDWDPAGPSFRRLGLRYVVSDHLIGGLRPAGRDHENYLLERDDYVGLFHFSSGSALKRAFLDDIHWNENSVRVELKPGQTGRLTFAQPWYPGWVARIDGARVPVERDDIFMAVTVPSGGREVSFAYRPAWLWPSAVASLPAAMLALAAAWGGLREALARQDEP